MSEITILQIVGVIIAIITLTFVIINPLILVPWRYNKSKKKEKHLKRLQREIIEPLYSSSIEREYFKVLIKDLDKLISLNSYNQTIQHLKNEYSHILTNFDTSINSIEGIKGKGGINQKLTNLKKLVLDRIKSELGEKNKKFLSSIIWAVVDNILTGKLKSLDDAKVEIRNDKIDIKLASDEKSYVTITPKYYDNKNKTKQFLSDLIEDINFRKEVEKIKGIYDNTKKLFNTVHKDLKKLIDDIDNEDELKGKCEKCSFWIRFLGDC